MLLFDTNLVSELRRAGNADARVIGWVSAIPASATYLSAITVMELEQGMLAKARRDALQGEVLRRWLIGSVLTAYEGRILPVDTAVARRCAQLHVPDPRSERDALIAATALVHGMTVATRDVADFAPMGVPVVNPWDA